MEIISLPHRTTAWATWKALLILTTWAAGDTTKSRNLALIYKVSENQNSQKAQPGRKLATHVQSWAQKEDGGDSLLMHASLSSGKNISSVNVLRLQKIRISYTRKELPKQILARTGGLAPRLNLGL
jgi:hypothetical protein